MVGKAWIVMLQAIGWSAVGTGFTFLMTTLGAAMVFLISGEAKPRFQKAVLGFAAGVMTAASVWSLLIPAIEQIEEEGLLPGWFPAAVGTVAGVAFLVLLDGMIPRLWRRKSNKSGKKHSLLMAAITLHNIPEGMAVGLAFALAASGENLAGAAALALGIGVQNFPEGMAIALPLQQQGLSRRRAFLDGMLSGSVEPVFGVLVVLAAVSARAAMPWLLSFSAGAMLYVVVEELIPQAHSRDGTCGFVAGFLLMMILDVALG